MIIKQATDPIQVDALKVLIYGQPGVRKSSWAFTAKNPFLLDFDNGVKRINPKYRGTWTPIRTWNDALGLFSPDMDLSKFDSIVIDTAGKALDMLALQIMKDDFKLRRKDGSLSIQGFGVLAMRFKDFMNQLVDLGKNVILVAHDKEVRSGDDTVIRPDITGQSMSNIIREVDLCGYMRAHNNRCIVTFNPSDNFYGKNTCGLPEHIDVTRKRLEDVIEEALLNMNEETEEFKAYKKQISEIESLLSNCKSANDLNKVKEEILGIKFISDGKIQAAHMMKTKATELGCKLNKTSKLYEDAKVSSDAPAAE